MNSRLKLLQSFCHLGNQSRLDRRCISDIKCPFDWSDLLSNSSGTVCGPVQVNDHPHVTESPKLPDSLTSSSLERAAVRKYNYKDDFPSLANWIEGYEVHFPEVDVGSMSDSDVDQISKILKCQFESPDAVVEALDGCCVELTDDLVEQILERFSFDWIPCFGFFKWATSRRDFMFSSKLYILMVDNMGKSRRFDVMFELLEEMKQLDGFISKLTMRKVIRRLSKAGRLNDAIDVFRSLEQFGLPKDIGAMNILLEALAKNRGIELAEKVYLEFKDVIPPNDYTFNILVHGWCKAKKMEKAEEIVSEMQRYGFRPYTVTWNSFIEAYGKKKDFHKIFDTLKHMETNGLVPSVVTYGIIVTALGKAKKVTKVLGMYEMMKQQGYDLDSSFYSALIVALSKSRRWTDAHRVFDDMTKRGVVPDIFTYNAMISGAVRGSRDGVALTILKEMEERQCKPNLGTYMPLLSMCRRLRKMEVLSILLSHMFRNNVGLDLIAYSVLVKGLCESGNLDRACEFMKESVNKGLVPGDDICRFLLKELDLKGMNKEKVRLQKLIQQAKLHKSVHSSKNSFRVQEQIF